MFEEMSFPKLGSADVVICGGGITGVAAGLAAAREGASVIILERSGSLGGMGTSGLVSMFAPRSDGSRDLSRGICSEIVEELYRRMGETPTLGWDAINPEILKEILDAKVTEAGIRLIFEVQIAAVCKKENRIERVVCATGRGLEEVSGTVFIDATGDAFIAAQAGVPYEFGSAESLPMSPTLCVHYTAIDRQKFEKSGVHPASRWYQLSDEGKTPLEERHFVGVKFNSPSSGCGNLGHIYGANTLDADSLTRCFTEGRKIARKIHGFYKEQIPGFENSQLTATGAQLGIRESRRIHGDYTLTFDDYCKRADFDDEIGRYNYPVDIHASKTDAEEQLRVEQRIRETAYHKGDSYGIPYRAMLPVGVQNLLVPGRALSADRAVQSSIRVMPGCCITAQAAGIAAKLALALQGNVRAISIPELQQRILVLIKKA